MSNSSLEQLPPVVITALDPDGEDTVWPPVAPRYPGAQTTWSEYQAALGEWLKENYVEIATFPDPRNEEWMWIVYLRKDLHDEGWGSFNAPRE